MTDEMKALLEKDTEVRDEYSTFEELKKRIQDRTAGLKPFADPVLDPKTMNYVEGTPKAKERFRKWMEKLEKAAGK